MIKNIAHSRKAKLFNLAGKDNKSYQQLLVKYFHECLLRRLANSQYRERLILKGGSLLYAYQEFVPRPTLDIDFLGYNIDSDHIIKAIVEIISSDSKDIDGVVFYPDSLTTTPITVEKKYPGIRISFDSSLDSIRKNLVIDIGFGDVITPSPVEIDYPLLFEDSQDIRLMAYSLETVVAEKFETMVKLGQFNSRMKDFFDLYRILSSYEFDPNHLKEAITATFINRGTTYKANNIVFTEEFKSDKQLNMRWNNYISHLKLHTNLSFFEIVSFITQKLNPYLDNLD